MRRRMAFGAIVAALVAWVFVVASGAHNSPLCSIYTSDNVEWWLFLCYL